MFRAPFRKVGRRNILSRFLLWLTDMDAVTYPWKLIYVRAECWNDNRLKRHELAHLRQIKRLGSLAFWVILYYQYIRFGHDNAPLEIEADYYARVRTPLEGFKREDIKTSPDGLERDRNTLRT